MTAVYAPSAPTLVDLLPDVRWRNPALVVGFALLTAVAAQISIPLGFTPVPLTGQTFAVLATGGLLGARRGSAAMALYVILGAVGLPFYAGGGSGWTVATGSTIGYLLGFVAAAALVGTLAERRADRKVLTALPAFLAGSALIYTFGAAGLALRLGVPFFGAEGSAIALGVEPFVIGDLIKVALAGLALPAGWQVASRFDND